MIHSQGILGLSVISIHDGKEIGYVRDLVINPETCKVQCLLIEPEDWYNGAKTLAFDQIQGIGEYAVIIEGFKSLQSLTERPDVAALLDKKCELKESKVLTGNGVLLGQVREFFIDEIEGAIMGALLVPQQIDVGERLIEMDKILSIGTQILLVERNLRLEDLPLYDHQTVGLQKSDFLEHTELQRKDEIEVEVENPEKPLAQIHSRNTSTRAIDKEEMAPDVSALLAIAEKALPKKEPAKPMNMKVAQAYKNRNDQDQREFLPLLQVLKEENLSEERDNSMQESEKISQQRSQPSAKPPGALFGELQHKYYIGKTLTKRIESPIGEILAEPGDVITETLLNRVKKAGKYLEMIIHVKE
ncbi:PRC-barrel domain-containing protein [Heliorestis convoluta]|uniref:Prc-barrel domain n=1 Tax=Heliorestis convoluta TaxID=356322 RepID=A0A5Q2MXA1_9FIRM|nr:PRC-barrel domain-containing protein [Heliorestis convoluta]QGG47127.1 prc-barrel domain [Heliorestis convoluta]